MLLINLVFKRIDSPVGLLKLVANDASLAAILWENDSERRVGRELSAGVRNQKL
jgi:hypothetical protein